MKKIILIVFLVIFNLLLAYSKVCSKDNIKLKLKNNELGIVIMNNNDSNAILLLKNDVSILYILNYNNDTGLKKNVSSFTNKVDYVFMNDNYDIDYPNKRIIENTIIEDININNDQINYLEHRFCLNKSLECDFTYLTEDTNIVDKNIKALIYNSNISENVVEQLEDDWLDMYKVSNDNYCIIILNDKYEITNLIR